MRYVHLQKKLQDKTKELEQLNKAEKEILLGTFDGHKMDFVSSCFGDDSTACCFCPGKPKSFLDDREKSKSMSSSSTKSSRNQKSDHLYYDCYRKSQSTKELNSGDPITGVGSIVRIQPAKKTQSGGELSSVNSGTVFHGGGGSVIGANSATSATGRCYQHVHSSAASHQSKSPTPSSIPGLDGAVSNSKPKSWDNLMTTKSFGGYGFGYGYGYSKGTNANHGGHHHFSHPHHHNHHTHCSNHPHYYYGTNNPKSAIPVGAHGTGNSGVPSRRSSVDSSSGCHGGESSSRPFTNYTTYKMVGTTRVVARVTMGNTEISSSSAAGGTRTLPSGRSSSTSRTKTPDILSNFPSKSKMEKTLSDSSLNSKDFPKTLNYFNKSNDNDGNYSSDDDYDEYATEAPLGPKNDIYV